MRCTVYRVCVQQCMIHVFTVAKQFYARVCVSHPLPAPSLRRVECSVTVPMHLRHQLHRHQHRRQHLYGSAVIFTASQCIVRLRAGLRVCVHVCVCALYDAVLILFLFVIYVHSQRCYVKVWKDYVINTCPVAVQSYIRQCSNKYLEGEASKSLMLNHRISKIVYHILRKIQTNNA